MDSSDGFVKNTETPYVVAGRETLGVDRVTQGHNCCGGCCDFRRHVRRDTIWANTLSAILSVNDAITFYQLHNSGQQYQISASTTFGLKAVALPTLFLLIWSVVQVLMYSGGAIGGVSYSTWLVGLAVLEYILDFVIYGITIYVLHALMVAVFAFQNIVFILEVRKGNIAKDNYHNEQQS